MNFSKAIKMNPWIGKDYFKENPKILVLGESCYTEDPKTMESNFVTNMISGISEDDWTHAYFTKIYNLFSSSNLFRDLEKSDFWNRIVFHEYVQEGLTGPRVRPSQDQWDSNDKAFLEILKKLEPDAIFCMGRKLYEKLPEFGGEHFKTYKVKIIGTETSANSWNYSNSGNGILVLEVQHPSTGFSYEPWIKIIDKFAKEFE